MSWLRVSLNLFGFIHCNCRWVNWIQSSCHLISIFKWVRREIEAKFFFPRLELCGRRRKKPAGCALGCLLKLQAVAGGERRKWRNASYSCESWPHSVAQGSCSPQRPWGTVARTSPRATQTQKHQMFPHFPPKIHFSTAVNEFGFGWILNFCQRFLIPSSGFSEILKDSLFWGSRISKNPKESQRILDSSSRFLVILSYKSKILDSKWGILEDSQSESQRISENLKESRLLVKDSQRFSALSRRFSKIPDFKWVILVDSQSESQRILKNPKESRLQVKDSQGFSEILVTKIHLKMQIKWIQLLQTWKIDLNEFLKEDIAICGGCGVECCLLACGGRIVIIERPLA